MLLSKPSSPAIGDCVHKSSRCSLSEQDSYQFLWWPLHRLLTQESCRERGAFWSLPGRSSGLCCRQICLYCDMKETRKDKYVMSEVYRALPENNANDQAYFSLGSTWLDKEEIRRDTRWRMINASRRDIAALHAWGDLCPNSVCLRYAALVTLRVRGCGMSVLVRSLWSIVGFLLVVPPAYSASVLPLNTIKLPPGFSISIYARDVPDARSMTLSPNGTLFVGTRKAGKVYAIRARDQARGADTVTTIALGLHMPNGVVFHDGALYVAEVNRILRYDNIEARLTAPPHRWSSPTAIRVRPIMAGSSSAWGQMACSTYQLVRRAMSANVLMHATPPLPV